MLLWKRKLPNPNTRTCQCVLAFFFQNLHPEINNPWNPSFLIDCFFIFFYLINLHEIKYCIATYSALQERKWLNKMVCTVNTCTAACNLSEIKIWNSIFPLSKQCETIKLSLPHFVIGSEWWSTNHTCTAATIAPFAFICLIISFLYWRHVCQTPSI